MRRTLFGDQCLCEGARGGAVTLSWAWELEALSWVSLKADGLLETTYHVLLLGYWAIEALGLR